MGRKFGDYIHLHWQNYYSHGTYRTNEQRNNYSEILFNEHYNHIKNNIQKLSIDKAQRDKIAQEYNTRNKDAWKLFASLLKQKNKNYNILYHILRTINQQWTDDFINEIIAGLKWNENLQTLVYTPTTAGTRREYKTSITGWPSIPLSTNGQFHLFNTIKKYITIAENYLKQPTMETSETVKNDLSILQGMQQRIIQEEQVLQSWDKTERQLAQVTKRSLTPEQKRFKTDILNKLLNSYVEQLNSMREKYVSAEEVNRQIQAALAEIFGNIVATEAQNIAEESVIEQIQEALSVGKKGSAPIAAKSNSIAALSTQAIEFDFIKNPQATKVVKSLGKSKDGNIKYSFTDIGQSRQQKRDVLLTVEAQDYGISVKNTDITNAYMKYDASKNNWEGSTVSLQNSSLMLFLLGMDQEQSGIGNHYLNALSSHPDVSGATSIQKQALQNLKLYTLYSALTGRGQLRNASGAAQVLAIYDKAPNSPSRVRLYDMSDIILAIEENGFTKGVKFHPALDSTFLLANTKILNDDDARIQKSIGERITNLLLEARRKTISVSIYTSWLKDSMKAF